MSGGVYVLGISFQGVHVRGEGEYLTRGGGGCYSFKHKLALTNMNDDKRNVQITGPTICSHCLSVQFKLKLSMW